LRKPKQSLSENDDFQHWLIRLAALIVIDENGITIGAQTREGVAISCANVDSTRILTPAAQSERPKGRPVLKINNTLHFVLCD